MGVAQAADSFMTSFVILIFILIMEYAVKISWKRASINQYLKLILWNYDYVTYCLDIKELNTIMDGNMTCVYELEKQLKSFGPYKLLKKLQERPIIATKHLVSVLRLRFSKESFRG
jgi:hypothetical protein